ncbi:mitochondrial 37S ribosomal protein rsm10 [Exophiala dermatitidis]|nr:mitochondrial 37S ribosomal protein rsm10 [Exophiala dermatitidis]KAJ4543453.1 mitochondrial 37S ribosomal protein rsm10 [Exophiala dermatitidis]
MPELGSKKIPDLSETEKEETPSTAQAPSPSKETPRPNVTAAKQSQPQSQSHKATKSPEGKVATMVSQSLQSASQAAEAAATDAEASSTPNVPPNVLAAYRTPMRHPLTHGIPVAELQLRSYSVRNLEFYADFAVRAAYYLGLPCTGPAPLPRKRERWTVLKSNFAHKKAQENFERITMKRLVTVYDGQPEVVEIWLAFLRKWQFYGVGMKANVWQWEQVDVAGKMDRDFAALEKHLDEKLRLFGFNKSSADKNDLLRLMAKQGHRQVGVGNSLLAKRLQPHRLHFAEVETGMMFRALRICPASKASFVSFIERITAD